MKDSKEKKPMRKSQLIATLAESEDLSKSQVRGFFESLNRLAFLEIKKSGSFALPELGKFTLKDRKARMGRNPATGAKIKIPAKTVLKFRVAKAAKDACLDGKR